MKRFRFNYVSADPGAGKTEWAIHQARKWIALGHPVLMVVPTRRLCNEIQDRSNGFIRAIHAENKSFDTTKLEIIEQLKDAAKNGPRGIVITDASFLLLDVKIGTENWVLIKDEPKEPLNIETLNLIDGREFFDDYFLDLIPDNRELLHQGLLKDFPYKLTSYDDCLFGSLKALQHYITTPEFEVLFDLNQYKDNNLLRYSVFTKPDLFDGWGEVYFMGAYFEDTFIYHQWKDEVEWVNKTPKRLQRMPSDRVVISYCFDAGAWSDHYRNRTAGGKTNMQRYIEWINTQFPAGDYVYVANNKYDKLDLGGVRMPAECHGLNSYRDYTRVALIGSYLESRVNEPFYHHYGSSTTDVRGMRNTQYYMQQLTRTAIRSYDNKKPIEICVPTRKEALDLLPYLTKATIVPPKQDRIGQLRKDWRPDMKQILEMPENGYNTLAYGAQARMNVIQKVDLTEVEEFKTPDKPLSNAQRQKRHYHKKKNLTKPGEITQYNNILYRRKNSCFVRHLEFIAQLANHISVVDKTKEEIRDIKVTQLPWYSVGIFTGNALKRAECAGSWGIGFDFDGTALTDLQISKILKRNIYMQYTTVSYDPTDPLRRIRVVIPFNRAVSIEEHDRIKRFYSAKFKEVCPNDLNLDEAKSDPWSKLFAPHAEAIVNMVYRKGNNKNTLLDPETILARVPRQPVISPPTIEDIQWSWPAGTAPQTDDRVKKKLHEIDEIIKTMMPNDRSHKATVVGGKLSKIPQEYHQQVWDKMIAQGVDKAALKSAKLYASKT